MNEDKLQAPQHASVRRTLRGVGLAVLARYFWCAFLGMPLLFVGSAMTMFGFLGAMNRFVAGESAPVAKDVVNYMGENMQPGVKAIAKAVAEGLQEGLDEGRDLEK